jgi:hypothetical protein
VINPKGMLSRLSKRAWLNSGFVVQDSNQAKNVYRDQNLETLDAYYENRQYADKLPWESDGDSAGELIPLRMKQPKIKVPFARTLSGMVASKLIGPSVFPQFTVEGEPDDQAYWRAVVENSQIQMFMLEPIRRMINGGETFIRFYLADGAYKKEYYDAKYCYPSFQDNGELELVTIKYIYTDNADKDSNGTPIRKWFRMDLGMMTEVVFDNPRYVETQDPSEVVFTPAETTEHGFGFVQGEWFTTTGDQKGYGITTDIRDFIDELCYSLSQSSKAVGYNQDPQLLFTKMSTEEVDNLFRSVQRAWQLGREGDAKFLESNLTGVQRAIELRDKVTQNISQLSRVVLLDPEKIVGSAQSAKAMEVLHGPLKDMVDELRLPVGASLKKLVMKMGIANLLATAAGMIAPIIVPEGFQLASFEVNLKWPKIFEHTLDDLKNKVAIAAQALTAQLIGPRTATKYIAEDFGIEDVESELADIAAHQAAMAALNPFQGGF